MVQRNLFSRENVKKFVFGILILGSILLIVELFSSPKSAVHGQDYINGQAVERIISLCKHPIPFIILGLDSSDHRLVGINPAAKATMETKVLNNYFPDFHLISDKVCTRSFAINIEEIIQLHPDVVFSWETLKGANEKMNNFNINVSEVLYDGTEQNDRDMLMNMAQAIGQTSRADTLISRRSKIQEEIENIAKDIPADEKLKAIFFYNYDYYNVGGEKCYENYCITLVGGINMGRGLGLGRNVNIEQILDWNPDIILYGGWRNDVDPELIIHNSLLSEVSAIKNKRVYKMPHWASTESPLIWQWMGEVFFPDKYNFDLRSEIKTAYKWNYNISLTESEIDKVLFLEENQGSSGYRQFKSSSN